jgi:uncharacterized Zn-finger protein
VVVHLLAGPRPRPFSAYVETFMPEDASRIRCPYCAKVFLVNRKLLVFDGEKSSKTIKCPYCKESLVLRKDMLQK